MDSIVIPEQVFPRGQLLVTSEKPVYKIDLTCDDKDVQVVPPKHDIVGMLMDFPEYLEEVFILIGNQKVSVFDRQRKVDLENFPIYLTLASYMNTSLQLEFNTEWLKTLETYEMVEEYEEVQDYGEEAEVYDGYEIHFGRIVTRREIPTGRMVKKITGGASITIPKITLKLQQNTHVAKNANRVSIPVRNKINLTRFDKDYIEHLKQNFNLDIKDEKTGYVNNNLLYGGSMAGLQYSFY